MTQEEKYKLALFAVIRNSSVMPQGIKLGKKKTMHEINTMTIAVMANIMESCDFEKLKAAYEDGKKLELREASHVETNKPQRGVCNSRHAQEGRGCEEWD